MLRVDRARHRVERPDFEGVLVHHEEVRAILVGYQVAQLLLVLRRQVALGVSCRMSRHADTRCDSKERIDDRQKQLVQKQTQPVREGKYLGDERTPAVRASVAG